MSFSVPVRLDDDDDDHVEWHAQWSSGRQ